MCTGPSMRTLRPIDAEALIPRGDVSGIRTSPRSMIVARAPIFVGRADVGPIRAPAPSNRKTARRLFATPEILVCRNRRTRRREFARRLRVKRRRRRCWRDGCVRFPFPASLEIRRSSNVSSSTTTPYCSTSAHSTSPIVATASLFAMKRQHAIQRNVGHFVATDDHERLAVEKRLHLFQAAGAPEQLRLVRIRQASRRTAIRRLALRRSHRRDSAR